MSILDWLRGRADAKIASGDTETVRRIVGELDKLDPAGARHLAAFAYVLSRVAAADLDVSEAEMDTMAETVERVGHLTEAQAILVVQIARNQNRLFGGTEDFLVTREFREIATDEQRRELVDCLFAVGAADGEISAEEEGQIRQVASELGISHADYVKSRLKYSHQRSVFRRGEG